ncbi:MAG TPA: SMC-Scp complex subunit ScpB [Abditibacteriaceae bacterium]|jgi:segregation and condensation protein B
MATKAEITDVIEALLFASDRPVPLKKLAQIVDLSPREVLAELDILREEKDRIGALQIIEVAGGWQVVTKPQFGTYIAKLREEKRQRLSRAAFEVLAIVAYRQPATRGDIEALRGVDCAGPVQFLLEKKLIAFAGRKDAPGRPWLYATTPHFLDHFGLRDVADLPSLSELAELNDAADGANSTSQELFRRGAMKSMDEVDAQIAERTHQESVEPQDLNGAAGDQSLNGSLTEATDTDDTGEEDATP